MKCGISAERYAKNYIRKDQLKRFVKLGVVTKAQYKELTGEAYKAD